MSASTLSAMGGHVTSCVCMNMLSQARSLPRHRSSALPCAGKGARGACSAFARGDDGGEPHEKGS
jgi:hypothetical protein